MEEPGEDVICSSRPPSAHASPANKPREARSGRSEEIRARVLHQDADEATRADKNSLGKSPRHTQTLIPNIVGPRNPNDPTWESPRSGKMSRTSKRRSTGDVEAQSTTSIPSIVKTSSTPTARARSRARSRPRTPNAAQGAHQDTRFRRESARKGSTDSGRSSSIGTDTLHPTHGLTKSHVGDAAGAGFFDLAHFLSIHTHDATSRAVATRGDPPRGDDLKTESQGSYSTPVTSSLPESESYYILAPRSAGSAYYLHRSCDSDAVTNAEFRITKVPMTLVPHETGGLSYIVRVSEEDSASLSQKDNNTPWSSEVQKESVSSSNAKVSPCLKGLREIARADQKGGCSPGTKKPLQATRDAPGLGAKFESIMAKINERLAENSQKINTQKIDETGTDVADDNGMFLVSNGDIRDIVTVVMEEVQKGKKTGRGEGNKHRDDAKRLSGPRLDGGSNNIRLPLASAADPATTISMPRTSYASVSAEDLQVHTKVRGEDSDTMTTVISRKSVAEITWPCNSPHLDTSASSSHSRAVSESETLTQGVLTNQTSDRRQSEPLFVKGGFVFHHYSTSLNESEVLSDMSRRQSRQKEKKTSDAADITSFPRLLPRRCTMDWLVPPTEVDVVPPPSNSSHRRGNDAHRGKTLEGPSKFFQGQSKARNYDHSTFTNNSFFSKSSKADAGSSGDGSPLGTFKNRPSTPVRTASQRRRSSQLPTMHDSSAASQESLLPGIMDKIRQGSHRIFYRHHSLRGSDGSPSFNDVVS